MDITAHGGQVTDTDTIAQVDLQQRLERQLGLTSGASEQTESTAALSPQVFLLLIVRGVDSVGRANLLKLACPGVVVDSQLRTLPYEQRGLSPAALQAEVLNGMLEHVELLMKAEHPMIGVSDTFSQRREIAPFLELAERMGYSVQVVMAEAVTGVENGSNRLVEDGELGDELRQFKESWEPFDPAIEAGIVKRGFANMIQSMNDYKGDET